MCGVRYFIPSRHRATIYKDGQLRGRQLDDRRGSPDDLSHRGLAVVSLERAVRPDGELVVCVVLETGQDCHSSLCDTSRDFLSFRIQKLVCILSGVGHLVPIECQRTDRSLIKTGFRGWKRCQDLLVILAGCEGAESGKQEYAREPAHL